MVGVDTDSDGVEAYEFALSVVRGLRGEWERLGCPMTDVGGSTGRVTVPHPLLREIREQEKLAAALRGDLRRRHRGPDPSAVIRPAVASPSLRKAG